MKSSDETINPIFSELLYGASFARNLFDSGSVKYRLSPGDAIAFNNEVLHKSNKFFSGHHPSRRSFLMRFTDVSPLYNKVNSDKTGGDVSVMVNRIADGDGQKFKAEPRTVIHTQPGGQD